MALTEIKVNNSSLIGIDNKPKPDSRNLVESGGIQNKLLLNSFIGKDNVYSDTKIYGLIPNHKYIVYLEKTSGWQYEAAISSAYIFSINAIFNETQTTLTGTCGGTSQLQESYTFITPEEFDYIRFGGRANAGVEVRFSVIDAVLEQPLKDAPEDFSISDENGDCITVFNNGHIKTKKFDSSKVNTTLVENGISSNDLIISDDNGYVLALFSDGHILTKYFDSSKLQTNDNILSSNLVISDDKGNVIAQFSDGHILTKNFDSSKTKTESFLMNSDVVVVMHRAGVCTTNYSGINVFPEESVWSLMAAKRCGVKYVEFDLQRTSDGKFVCIHDGTINRTMMNSDGSPISSSVSISSLTLQLLKTNYVYKSSIQQYRTPIITLDEFCDACRKLELTPYYHGDSGGNSDYVTQVMHDYCGDFAIFLTGTGNMNALINVRKNYPNALIIYDEGSEITAENMVNRLNQIGGKCGCSTMLASYTTKNYCNTIRKAGYYVQCSIHNGNLLQSLQNGCNMILDNWSIPYQSGSPIKCLDTADNMNEFATNGSIENSIILLNNGNTVTLQPDNIYLGGFELIIYFIGSISISTTGSANQVVSSSDLSTPIVLRKATIKDTASIVITATATTEIYEISYKQFKF